MTVPRFLFGLALSLVAVDLTWASLVHFDIDYLAYAKLGAMALALFMGGTFYRTKRPEPALAAMLLGTSFLIVFSAAASMLNYFLLTVAGPRIDLLLAAADGALGFDWYRTMLIMAHHPILNGIFFYVYNLALPEIALVLIALAWCGKVQSVYRFCLAIALGALIAIAIWALVPSLGAKSLYTLPASAMQHLRLSVDCAYGRALVALLHNGPGYISPADLRGLIAFPSYHGVLALILVWYAREVRRLRWPILIINGVMLVSLPIQGGHHMVDVLASFPVTALTLFLAESRKLKVLVKEPRILTLVPAPAASLRIASIQGATNADDAVKPILNCTP
jgi:hypothetical protein